jgi:hypothetical protein
VGAERVADFFNIPPLENAAADIAVTCYTLISYQLKISTFACPRNDEKVEEFFISPIVTHPIRAPLAVARASG